MALRLSSRTRIRARNYANCCSIISIRGGDVVRSGHNESSFRIQPPLSMSRPIDSSALFSTISPPASRRQFSSSVSSSGVYSNGDSASDDHRSLLETYEQAISSGKVTKDPHQKEAILALDRLYHDLLDHDPPPLSAEPPHEHEQPRLNTFFGFFGRAQRELKKVSKSLSLHHYPKGVYLHGGVGCGKTFVMDMFYNTLESIPTWHDDRQKVHFHKFMLDVHQQMHESKYVEGVKGDVLPSVIQKTLEKGRLICFDEFQVTDVADALILRRLFTGLLEQGAVIVATSNRPPDDLYLNGLQRDRFLPFIDLLKERCEIVSLWDSETDYRLIQAEQKAKGVYFVGKEAKKDFKSVFYALTKNRNVIATSLTTQGRSVSIPMACLSAGVARFTFEDLCTKALGAADYLVIAQHFHTVFVSDIPVLTLNEVNYLRRFITFIDVMYECHVKLIIHAKAAPSGLFEVDLNNRYNDEVFAFDRTRSRLEEMGSDEYLQKRWAGGKQLTLNYNLKVLFEPSLGDNTIDAEPTIGARAGHGTTP